ncbi:MAG TPA: sn-glycerol-3-phosphate ABC transporter ATP-binding protein UgpC [Thermoanaerobaculia bacterium]
MAGVTFRGVDKKYGEVFVIEDLNLDVVDCEFLVLVGPSGCGKTTALRMIAGLEEVSGGTIAIGERVVNDVAPKDRDIAMVFQNYALYPHMTVRENLEFGLKMRKTPEAEREGLVSEAADLLGLASLLDRKPAQLSGGQRQRVALGRAIVRHPAVFLFDEPLSNLDAKLRVQMRAEIKKLQQRLQTTTVYVTHDQVEAMTMGSRIAVMHRGKIQQLGTPQEIYDRPENLFVASFVGTPPMNLFPATLDDGRATAAGFSLPIPARLRPALSGGTKVILGIRPEDLVISREEARGPSAPLPLSVDVVEPLGDAVLVHGRAGEAPVVGKLEPHQVPRVGEHFDLWVELEKMHVFDAATERRVDSAGSQRPE